MLLRVLVMDTDAGRARGQFLHLVSDHLCASDTDIRCARQLVAIAEAERTLVSRRNAEAALNKEWGMEAGKRLAMAKKAAEVLGPDRDINLFGLRQHSDRRCGGMDASARFRIGHALDAVDA